MEKKFGTYIQTRHTVEDIVRRAKLYKDNEVNATLDQIQSEGKWNRSGVVADMTFKPGDVTVATLQNDFKSLFILTGTVMENKEAYYGSSGWVNNLKIAGQNVDIKELLNTIMTNRVNHHYPTAYYNLYQELIEFTNWKRINIFQPVKYANYMQNPPVTQI